ncbi:hypothetical protein [Nitrosomonas sp.]|uniref:hypothetical protein n=1 Tax=Nitrosomonas sp. TaxID=42353 RepID=UPI0032F0565D
MLALAGLLVGYGARLGSGCTSSWSWSVRFIALVAALHCGEVVFMLTGFAAIDLLRHVLV